MAKLLMGISGRVEAGETLTAVLFNTGTGTSVLTGFTLQWQVFNGSTWTNIGAANSLTLSIPNNSSAIGLAYRLVATPTVSGNEAGTSLATGSAIQDKSTAHAPTLDGLSTSLTVNESAAATLLDSSVTFADQDNGNYGGGTLTIFNSNSLSAGGDGHDILSVLNAGTGAGQISYDAVTGRVYYSTTSGNPVLIGQVDTTLNGNGSDLKITFNTSATAAMVDKLIEDIRFANNDDSPVLNRLLTFRVVDPTGASVQRVMQVNVTAAADAPVFTSPASYTADENQTAVGSVAALDPDRESTAAQGITYSLVAGTGSTDNTLFAIDGTTGVLRFLTAPNFEGTHAPSYSVRVRAADSNGGITERVVTVQVRNVNEGPTASNVSASVGEETIGASIWPVYSDPDAGDTLTLSLDTTGTRGSVHLSNGRFIYDAYSFFDTLPAGQTTTDTFKYTVTDAGGLSVTKTVTVTVTGANDPAAILVAWPAPLQEDVNVTGGQLVAQGGATVFDLDAGESKVVPQAATAGILGTFSIDAAGNWTYTANNGSAAVQSLGANDSVTETFTIRSFDGTATQAIQLTIYGANDAATISGTSAITLVEDASSPLLTGGATLQVSDVDAGQNQLLLQVNAPGSAGLGFFNVNPDGSWNYQVQDSLAGVQALGEGATLTDSTTVYSRDGTASKVITATIVGRNDAPVVAGGTASGSVAVGGAASAQGAITAQDVDAGDTRAWSGSENGTYGQFAIDAVTGQWTYTLDNARAATQSLVQGQSVTETFTATVTDAHGATAQQQVVVTVTGANDAPTSAGGTSTGSVAEDGASTAQGQLPSADVDAGDTRAWSGSANGVYGQFAIDSATGNWVYLLDNSRAATQALAAGQCVTETFAAVVTDSQGATAQREVVVSITGAKDAPVSTGGTSTGSVAEDGASIAQGTLPSSDVDTDDTGTWSGSADGTYGQFAIDAASGEWTYTLHNSRAATQALAAGQSITETFAAVVTDSQGATAQRDVVVTITGTNDAPTSVGGTASGSVAEDGASSAQGTLPSSDVDSGDTHSWSGSANGTYGQFAINAATGQWTYTLDNTRAATQSLAQGQSVTESFTTTVTDAQGAIAQRVVTVTVNGANDAPTVNASSQRTGTVQEDTTNIATGALIANDVDTGDSRSWSGGGNGTYGQLTVSASGNWTYTLDNSRAATQALAQGQSVTETFTTTVTDSRGATAQTQVTITVNGKNDAPTSTGGTSTGSVTEDGPSTATGTLPSVDVDSGSTRTWSGNANGTYGQFVINAGTGQWTYTLDNSRAATQSLNVGQVVTDVFTATVSDGQGGTAQRVVTVSVNGTNDFPGISASSQLTGTVKEDVTSTATGNLFAAGLDPDQGDSLAFSGGGNGTYGQLTLTPQGTWTYTLDNSRPATQALQEGQSVADTFTVTLADQHGGSQQKLVTITVNGTNESAPVVSGDMAGSVGEPGGGTGMLTLDVDGGDYGSQVVRQADGKLVVSVITTSGPFGTTLARFNVDGTLDTSFGTAGKVFLPDGPGKLALDDAGRALVMGDSSSGTALTRLTTSGQLDSTFAGDGRLETTLRMPGASAITVDGQGRILVFAPGTQESPLPVIERYLPDGTLDPTFGWGGRHVMSDLSTNLTGIGLDVDAQDRIVLTAMSGSSDYVVERLTSHGQADESFGYGGHMWLYGYGQPGARMDVEELADGRTVFAFANQYNELCIARLDADGQPDLSFGNGGIVDTHVHANPWDQPLLEIDSAGRIVAAAPTSYGAFGIGRFLADGSVDTSFGYGGQAWIPQASGNDLALVAGPGGTLLVKSNVWNSTGGDISLVRLLADGSLDHGFGVGSIPTVHGVLTADRAGIVWSGDMQGQFGAFHIDAATGEWTYTAGSAADSLRQGDTAHENFTVTATVGGASTQVTIGIDVLGQNDRPNITDDVVNVQVTEDMPWTQGALLAIDPDAYDTRWWTSDAMNGPDGYFWVSQDGSWSWGGNMTTTQALGVGQTETHTINVTVRDSIGESDSAQIRVTVVGANDAPGIVSDEPSRHGSVTEPGANGPGTVTATGTLQAVDPDAGDTLTWSVSRTPMRGTLSIDAGGTWTYSLDVEAANAMREGDTQLDWAEVTVTDSHGATTMVPVMVDIHGANDAPVYWPQGSTDTGMVPVGHGTGGTLAFDNGADGYSDSGYVSAMDASGRLLVLDRAAGGTVLTRLNANGTLDTSFGSGGHVTVAYTGLFEHLAIASDGSIVISGTAAGPGGSNDFTVLKLHGDGTWDTDFGFYGKAQVDIGNGNGSDVGANVMFDASGGMLVAGTHSQGFNDSLVVARLNASGNLDTSYGSGGYRTLPGGAAVSHFEVARDSGGGLLYWGYNAVSNQLEVRHVFSNGAIDAGFGTSGLASMGAPYVHANLVLAPGGGFVLGWSDGYALRLARFDASGHADAGFGYGGQVNVQGSFSGNVALAFDSQGRLLVGGSNSSQDAQVMRLNGDGSFDNSFGDHGVVTRDISHGSADSVKQLFVDSQGHVLAAGLADFGGMQDVGLVSLLANGSGNPAFGEAPAGATTSGQLQAYDADASEYNLAWSGSATGTYGTLTMQPNGAWTYQVDNSLAATQGIGANQVVTDTFTVSVADSYGASTPHDIVVTLVGAP